MLVKSKQIKRQEKRWNKDLIVFYSKNYYGYDFDVDANILECCSLNDWFSEN